jgi:hypothetical protein
MRVNLGLVLTGVLLIASPALAGNVTATNNQVVWQSTQCTAPPAAPAPLAAANRHSSAEDMNKRVTEYNQYVEQVQAYMDCVSKEAQTDAASANQAITGSAQKAIDDERKSVADLAAPLQAAQKK